VFGIGTPWSRRPPNLAGRMIAALRADRHACSIGTDHAHNAALMLCTLQVRPDREAVGAIHTGAKEAGDLGDGCACGERADACWAEAGWASRRAEWGAPSSRLIRAR
jgi:hypothetical protein